MAHRPVVSPTILLGLVFWFIVRAIVRADRRTYAKVEAEERARRSPKSAANGQEDD